MYTWKSTFLFPECSISITSPLFPFTNSVFFQISLIANGRTLPLQHPLHTKLFSPEMITSFFLNFFHKRFSRITTQSGLFTKWDLQPVLKMATLLCLHGQSNDLWSIFLYELKIQKCTALLCNLWPLALKVFSMYFGKTRSTSSLLSYEFSSAVLRILFSLCNSIFCL